MSRRETERDRERKTLLPRRKRERERETRATTMESVGKEIISRARSLVRDVARRRARVCERAGEG